MRYFWDDGDAMRVRGRAVGNLCPARVRAVKKSSGAMENEGRRRSAAPSASAEWP